MNQFLIEHSWTSQLVLIYCCQNVQVMTLWMIFIEKLLEPSAIDPSASHYAAFYLHFWQNLQNIEMHLNY